jgi:uncharacterized UPF0160 family protein
MLKLLPEYAGAGVVRSRDPQTLAKCDVVVDVGGVYDHGNRRYDHHQRSFSESLSSLTNNAKPWTTKLSSAGLVYHHYGNQVISILTGIEEGTSNQIEVYDAVYDDFVQEIDAIDNGIPDIDGTPRYKKTSTISSRISRLNPSWNDPDQETDARFVKAMEMVGKEFESMVRYAQQVWLPARNIVSKAFKERYEADGSGEILTLEVGCPWVQHLFDIENKNSVDTNVKFVLYPEKGSDKWRVQAVPIFSGSFTNRVPLLECWRGLRDDELSTKSGIEGCVFVHISGFIGGNHSYKGALKMAQETLRLTASNES